MKQAKARANGGDEPMAAGGGGGAGIRRSLWAPTLLLVLVYLGLHATSYMVFFESRRISPAARLLKSAEDPPPVSDSAPPIQPPSTRPPPPLRIYMYELPKKFTLGVIEAYSRSRRIQGEVRYPGNQHSAEWWLFDDLQRQSRPSSSRIRVLNPDEADVFYVPFFSSLSLVATSKNGKDADISYRDEEMQEEMMAWLEKQAPWRRNGGRDHVVICQDPNALHRLRGRLKNAMLLLSDFGRFRAEQASLVKDVVLPYTHRIASYSEGNTTIERNKLLFFMGNRYRKQGGKIRDQLFRVLDDEEDMIIKHGTQSRQNRREAAAGMRASKFCLHPAGDTPSACRLFDAIVSVCVPVVVSDDIELPFEDELDYTEFCVFVPTSRAVQPGYLGSLLRNISSQELEQKQRRLREVRRYFEYGPDGAAVDMIWDQVRKKLPLVRTMINRDRRRVAESSSNCSCVCGGVL